MVGMRLSRSLLVLSLHQGPWLLILINWQGQKVEIFFFRNHGLNVIISFVNLTQRSTDRHRR